MSDTQESETISNVNASGFTQAAELQAALAEIQPEQENLKQSQQAFESSLGQFSDLPEIRDSREDVVEAGKHLIAEYQIMPELFADPGHALFFAALAHRRSQLGQKPDDEARVAEGIFIESAVMMLSLRLSGRYEEFKQRIDADQLDNESQLERVYEKFTNRQVTAELQAAIDNGLLDNVKKKLGIDSGNKDPYVLRVLNLAGAHATDGMQVLATQEQMDVWTSPDWDRHNAETQYFKSYQKDLIQKGEAFLMESGKSVNFPPAWIETVNGVRNLCIPLPYAEKILYRDQRRSSNYTQEAWERDFAFLEHEYTHTQGHLSLDDSLFYGAALENTPTEQSSVVVA